MTKQRPGAGDHTSDGAAFVEDALKRENTGIYTRVECVFCTEHSGAAGR
jgi:hypothetical protein